MELDLIKETLSDLFFSEKYSYYRNAATILGTLYVGRLIFRELCGLLSGFRAFFLAPMGIGRLNLRKYGNWAVVTGASEGIGRCYALELAKSGLNVVLMSRSEEKLHKVATEIREKYGRDTRVIPVDFTDGFEIYARLAEQLDSLDVGVLVNNVGLSYDHADDMGNVPPELLYRLVEVNCQPVVQISRIVLPKMVAKGGGVIVNLSTILSIAPLRQNAVYSSTKAHVNYVSHALRKEYSSRGIIVQNVLASGVATGLAKKMANMDKPNLLVQPPEAFAKAAVATIGIQDDTFGCFNHACQGFLSTRFQSFAFNYFWPSIFRYRPIER